jgi:hypothetical protein
MVRYQTTALFGQSRVFLGGRAELSDRKITLRFRYRHRATRCRWFRGARAETGFTSYDPTWFDSMTRLVQRLCGTGAQVLVLEPIPDPQSDVPTCLVRPRR